MASDGVEETHHILVIRGPDNPPTFEFSSVFGFIPHMYA